MGTCPTFTHLSWLCFLEQYLLFKVPLKYFKVFFVSDGGDMPIIIYTPNNWKWLMKQQLEIICKISWGIMAPHSCTLAWKIPWTEEPGRLQSMGSLRVGHDWATSLSLFTFMHWTGKWQPTPVFLPGESQGQRSLMGCCLWGRTESDTTEAT